jgi:predicted RNA polymerase sigma factor
MASGPEAGLAVTEPLLEEKSLKGYHLLPAVRGDLLMKLQRYDEAVRELRRAAELAGNARDRALLLDRVATCERARAATP